MSTATRRSLQIEERPKVLIRSNGKGHACRNGDSHVSSNGKVMPERMATAMYARTSNGHVSPNGNGHASSASTGHANGAAAWNGSYRNASSRNLPKTRVFVAAENRLLREALSRMLTKTGDIEVLTSEAGERFQKSAQNNLQSSLQKDDPGQFPEPETPALPGIQDAEILLLPSKGTLDQDLAAIRKIRSASKELVILLIDAIGDGSSRVVQAFRT